MTRTGACKTIYVSLRVAVFLIIVAAVALVSTKHFVLGAIGFAVVAMVLVSNRILAYFWSDLIAGLHYLNQHDYQTSKLHSERFLEQLRERPWLKTLIWLGTSSYSRDAEVLALNNLGAAELEEIEAARTHLSRAMELDPKCPLPYRNMGRLVARAGPGPIAEAVAEAKQWFEKAAALGLNDDWSDRLVRTSQRRNALLSTVGFAAAADPLVAMPEAPTDRSSRTSSTTNAASTGACVELFNDDQTPIEFVITTLEQVLGLSRTQAIRIALAVHKEGRAICAVYDDENVARATTDQLAAAARAAGFPLRSSVISRMAP